ncbi:unnamed protein product [Alternaria alternata]
MFGIRIVFALALVLALANIVATSGPTSIFIDQIDEYALLATCAELELSTIVRDMKYGCGDGGDASTPRSATSTPPTPVSSPQPTEATEQASTPKNNRTVAIAAGVAVPVVVLASAFVAFFLFRRHKNKKQHSRFDVYEVDASTVDASKAGTCHEVSDKGQIAAEMPNPDPQELDGESRGT